MQYFVLGESRKSSSNEISTVQGGSNFEQHGQEINNHNQMEVIKMCRTLINQGQLLPFVSIYFLFWRSRLGQYIRSATLFQTFLLFILFI